MDWVRVAAIAGLAALVAPAALAQDSRCRDAEFDSHTATLGDFAPMGGASFKKDYVRPGSEGNCRAITFYRVAAKANGPRAEFRDKVAPPFFAARYVGDDKKAPYKVQWTDEKRCPALVRAIEKLEPILAPRLTGEGPYRDAMTSNAGEAVYRLWLSGPAWPQREEDYTLSVNVESGGKTPLANWLDDTMAALASCWAAEAPLVE